MDGLVLLKQATEQDLKDWWTSGPEHCQIHGPKSDHDPETDLKFILNMNELAKAKAYKALYDDGMRIDRATVIIKKRGESDG